MLKEILPPILLRLIKPSESQKEYHDYWDALNHCTSDAYKNIELCNIVADKTVAHSKILKQKPFELGPTCAFFLAALNQFLNITNVKKLSILDFGGACGAHYFEMRRFISSSIKVNWYVVETDQMVKSAINRGLKNNELQFYSAIDDISDTIDFVHSSGTLQYVPNPYTLLSLLLKTNASHLFFNRMMFNDNNREFITIQKSYLAQNGPGKLPEGYEDKLISYPHTTLSLRKFNSMVTDNDYILDWIFEEQTGSYPIKGEKIKGLGLFYSR